MRGQVWSYFTILRKRLCFLIWQMECGKYVTPFNLSWPWLKWKCENHYFPFHQDTVDMCYDCELYVPHWFLDLMIQFNMQPWSSEHNMSWLKKWKDPDVMMPSFNIHRGTGECAWRCPTKSMIVRWYSHLCTKHQRTDLCVKHSSLSASWFFAISTFWT